jgi:hypothetical protein
LVGIRAAQVVGVGGEGANEGSTGPKMALADFRRGRRWIYRDAMLVFRPGGAMWHVMPKGEVEWRFLLSPSR